MNLFCVWQKDQADRRKDSAPRRRIELQEAIAERKAISEALYRLAYGEDMPQTKCEVYEFKKA